VDPVVGLELWMQFWARIVDPVFGLEFWMKLLDKNCGFNRITVDEMAPDACYISDLEFCFKLLHCSDKSKYNNRSINQNVSDNFCIYEN
jgi:hypothetical protein